MDWELIGYQISQELINILVPVVIVICLKWAVDIFKRLQEKNPKLAELLTLAGQVGYNAAEDYFRNREFATGDQKMLVAIEHARDYLLANGINVSDDVIKDMVDTYGISNYKFSWTKPKLSDWFGEDDEEQDDTEPKEEDHERSATGDLGKWVHDYCDQPDHDEHSEESVRQDQGMAASKDGQ